MDSDGGDTVEAHRLITSGLDSNSSPPCTLDPASSNHPSIVHTSGPSLPIEIWERVIDEVLTIDLVGYSQEILSCARTCRAWRPRCRYWLFHMVLIRTLEQLHLLSETMRTSPHLGALVTAIMILPKKREHMTELTWLAGDLLAVHLTTASVIAIMSHVSLPENPVSEEPTDVPMVQDAGHDFRSLGPKQSPLDSMRLLLPFRSSPITAINLSNITIPDFSEMCSVITQFPTISCLRFYSVQWRSPVQSDATFVIPTLLELAITPYTQLDPEQALLGFAGPSLRFLMLELIAAPSTDEHVSERVDLSRFTSLQGLRLDTKDICLGNHSWIPRILSTITSREVTSITIRCTVVFQTTIEAVLDRLECGSISNILDAPQFSDLRFFLLEFGDSSDHLALWESGLAALCPQLVAKGIVEVTVNPRVKFGNGATA
ncbi:hypothetical protein OBBRIDRAFT_90295 [Obba rivulosa]|uniref:F-box domain-containing protein n=1 Tax=Obba rivulosa TaxID=1052685 RepID=A0A8E2DIV1_9APHY|nr:hypothetical protein OBBRIDRAFT_90295 [Obba rivulosa]